MGSPLISQLEVVGRAVATRDVESFPLSRLQELSARLGAPVAVIPPLDAHLSLLKERIYDALKKGRIELPLMPLEWLDVPWLAFSSFEENLLCSNPVFLRGLERAAIRLKGVAERCVSAYLIGFDNRSSSNVADFAALIRQLISEGFAPSWAVLHKSLNLFDENTGPRTAVATFSLAKPTSSLAGQLGSVGLKADLIRGGFSFAMLLRWCSQIHSLGWEMRPFLEEWMRLCSDTLPAKDERVVEALLQPWLYQEAMSSWRQPLVNWFLANYGEPRSSGRRFWDRVKPEYSTLFQRWFTLRTIESFFLTVENHAKHNDDEATLRQLPYREAFWIAYHRRGVVLDARAMIGPEIEAHLSFRTLKRRFGSTLGRLEEFDPKLSALILRLPGLIVFVGSQNTSCRIWEETSPHAPSLTRKVLRRTTIIADPRTDLRIDALAPDTGIQQRGSENGIWQRKLRGFLWLRLKIDIPDREMLPVSDIGYLGIGSRNEAI